MITSQQRKLLKARAHSLKPVVITGVAGISPAVLTEIDRALEHHELIKIRVNTETALQRSQFTADISAELNAETIQTVGHVVTLFRENKAKAVVARPAPTKRRHARYTGSSRSRTP